MTRTLKQQKAKWKRDAQKAADRLARNAKEREFQMAGDIHRLDKTFKLIALLTIPALLAAAWLFA